MDPIVGQVCAIVVVYYPDFACLERLLVALAPQVDHLVVVDNGTDAADGARLRAYAGRYGLKLIVPGENIGVAAALNRGIAWAQGHGCSHVIFFDQDSEPSSTLVLALLGALAALQADKVPVAAVGPVLVDRRTGARAPFVHIGALGVRRIRCDTPRADPDEVFAQIGRGSATPTRHCNQSRGRKIKTDFLISSGMLAPVEVFDRVGLLEEALFIDNVDLEWCFRARSLGLDVYGVCDARMLHSVGDQVMRLGPGAIYRHHPIRQYYIMRNRILLYGRSYTHRAWIAQDFFRLLFKFAAFSLFFPPRMDNLRMMLRGIRDGLRGRAGQY